MKILDPATGLPLAASGHDVLNGQAQHAINLSPKTAVLRARLNPQLPPFNGDKEAAVRHLVTGLFREAEFFQAAAQLTIHVATNVNQTVMEAVMQFPTIEAKLRDYAMARGYPMPGNDYLKTEGDG